VKDGLPLTLDGFTYGLSDRYTKSRVAVEDSDADLDFCDLSLEVPRHQRLAE
jgi:hypothetical protein